MSLQKYNARVSEKRVFNQKYIIFHIELIEPHRLEFKSGQYLLLDIPEIAQKKHYSIASMPAMNHGLELLVDISPAGVASHYLERLQPGEEITFMAPLGAFTLANDPTEESLVFVATGSGIAPIRSMILDLLIEPKDERSIKLFWGMRYAKDLFWEEEFFQMAEDHQNFSFDLILSSPPDDWQLSKGYVTDLIQGYLDHYDKTGFYLCGSSAMIQDAHKLLRDKGVDEEKIHWEKFY